MKIKKGIGEEFLEHLDIYFKSIPKHPKHFPKKENPTEKHL